MIHHHGPRYGLSWDPGSVTMKHKERHWCDEEEEREAPRNREQSWLWVAPNCIVGLQSMQQQCNRFTTAQINFHLCRTDNTICQYLPRWHFFYVQLVETPDESCVVHVQLFLCASVRPCSSRRDYMFSSTNVYTFHGLMPVYNPSRSLFILIQVTCVRAVTWFWFKHTGWTVSLTHTDLFMYIL